MKLVNWRAALYGVFSSLGIALLFGAAPSIAVPIIVAPVDQGTVFLQKAGAGYELRWVNAGQADVVQKIVDKIEETGNPVHACKLVLQPRTAPNVGLMQIPEGPSGLTNGYIGVRTLAACSEITGSEVLTFALGGVLEGFQVSRTELDIRMKGTSVARIDTTLDGQVRTFIFKTPGAPNPNPLPPGATVIECVYSGLNQCRFVADDLWTQMTITALQGRIAVNANGSAGAPSKFLISKALEEELDCDENRETLTATDPNGATAVGTRLPNTDAGSCDPIPYSLGWNNEDPEHPELVFTKNDLGQAVATTFTITWPNAPTPEEGDNGVIGAVGVSAQQFVEAEGLKPLDLCVGTPVYVLDPVSGELVLESLQNIPASEDLSPSLPGLQYGCVYERRITYPAEGSVGLVERIYLEGDWSASRTR